MTLADIVILCPDEDLVAQTGLEGEVDGKVCLVGYVIIGLDLVVGGVLIFRHSVNVEVIKPLKWEGDLLS